MLTRDYSCGRSLVVGRKDACGDRPPAFCRDCVNLEQVWERITHLWRGRDRWFETTLAHYAVRSPPVPRVELSSYSYGSPYPPLLRKVRKWPPSSYPTANNWR